MPKTAEELDKKVACEKAYTDEGFTIEREDSMTIYRRPVSDDVIETSRYLARRRAIGYTSKDIPGHKRGKRD